MPPRSALFACLLCLLPGLAIAQSMPGATEILQTAMAASLDGVFADLQILCIKYLGLFLLIQFIFTHYRQVLSGSDLSEVMAKFVAGIFWAVLCYYVYENGADFIKGTASFVLGRAAALAGTVFDPSFPILSGIDVVGKLFEALDATRSALSMLNPLPSILMGLIAVAILAASGIIAFRIFMIFIETKIVIALSPISFMMLGLSAFKDQGLAPFKYLLSMAYRVFLMAAILVAMAKFSDGIIAAFAALPEASDPSIWPPLFAAAMGYGILGALAWNSNAIAAQLAAGTSAMTSSDAGGPAAIGAAVGAALGGGVGSAASSLGVGKAAQGMGDWMKSAFGGSGSPSISNASTEGLGGGIGAAPAKPSASMSMAQPAGNSGEGAAPAGAPSDGGTARGAGQEGALPAGSAEKATAMDGGNGAGFGGTPNTLPDDSRASRAAARRQAKQGGSGEGAGIGAPGQLMPTKPQGGIGRHLAHIKDEVRQNVQSHAVHVTMNAGRD